MNNFSHQRWAVLWRSTGTVGDPTAWYGRLATAYAEPHRHYHNQHHIAECLLEFDSAPVYSTEWFQRKYEQQARSNLQRSICNLKRLTP